MNERERLLAKIEQGPKSVRLEDLEKLMELWGFKAKYGKSGDSVIFWHQLYRLPEPPTAAKPHHGPVLSVYVKNCLKAIEIIRLKQEEESDA